MFHDPIAVEKFKQLVEEFSINTLIETGTDQGHGAREAKKIVNHVHTIDNNSDLFLKRNLGPGISEWCGNSPDILRGLLTLSAEIPLRPTICFYLDAHGGEYWPLLDELKVIAELGPRSCVIIIHDFKVPGKPWGFDSYGGKDLDLDYVRESLSYINQDFNLSYNQVAEGNKRGILYALPPIERSSLT
jgi:hypothetical protein